MNAPDLFERTDRPERPPCGECVHLDPKPIDSGIRYCREHLFWQWADERVHCAGFQARPAA